MLNTIGLKILIIQKFKFGSFEYHKSKSTMENIKKMLNGTKIVASKTIKREKIIPFTVFEQYLINFKITIYFRKKKDI